MDCNGRFSERLANLERDLKRAQQYVKDHHLARTDATRNLKVAAEYLKDAKRYQRKSRIDDSTCGYAKRIARRAAMQLRAARQMFEHGGQIRRRAT